MATLKQRDIRRLNRKWKCTLPADFVDFMKKYDPDCDVLEPDCIMLTIDGKQAVVEGVMITPLQREPEDEIPGCVRPIEDEIDDDWGGIAGPGRPKWLPPGAIPIGGAMWNAAPLLFIDGPHAGEVWFSSSIRDVHRVYPAAKDFRTFLASLVVAPPLSVPRIGRAL